MRKNEQSSSFTSLSSEDYLFGKAIANFVFPSGLFSCGEAEIRKLITQLGLCNRPDAKDIELERRELVKFVWWCRRDRDAYDRAGEKGFRLVGLNHIPRDISSCSLDYQLSLFE